MSKVDHADRLAMQIVRHFSPWPQSVNECTNNCKSGYAAIGHGICVMCLIGELAQIVGDEAAQELFAAARKLGELRGYILELAREKNDA